MSDAHAELSRHPPAPAVPLEVLPLRSVIDCVWVERFCDDTAPRRGHAIEATQQTARSRPGAEHPEVLAKHDDRVEEAERVIDSVETENARVANIALLARRDRPGRGVDPDDLETAFLKMEGSATAAATDIEHTTAHEAHRTALVGVVPALEWREEVRSVERHDEAVITLDDLPRRLPRKGVLEDGAPDIANAWLSHPQVPSIKTGGC
jgi:hypothetical protein